MHSAGKIVSAEDQLALMRKGLKAKLELKLGGLVIECRLLPMIEEAQLISNAEKNLKIPEGHNIELFRGAAIMKSVLRAAATVDDKPQLSMELLDKMTDQEITSLYDQYLTLKASVDPEFENMSSDKVIELIQSIKKKETAMRDLYTWQLAVIGRFFLVQLQLEASAPGS